MGVGIVTHAKHFNKSAPGANTNAITSIKPNGEDSALRITVALTTSSVLNLMVTDGTTTHALGLNKSTALNAADVYVFDVPVIKREQTSVTQGTPGKDLSYNLQVETDSVIEFLMVQEIFQAF